MDIAEKLQEAIGTGELITVVYNGGSQPGTAREILPLQLTDKKLRARCYTSNTVKTFMIDRIEICLDQISTPSTFDPTKKPDTWFINLKEAYINSIKELEQYGWHTVFTDEENGDLVSISLHSFFKNGKIRKTPDISLTYSKFIIEENFDIETGNFVEHKRESKRPYSINGSSFGKIEKAVEILLDNAKKLAPASK